METMERQAVRSRDIALIGYDSLNQILEITFRIGGVYHYAGVSEEIYKDFLAADSKGNFFEQKIKHNFSYRRVS